MHDHGGRGGPARPPRRRWRPYLAALVAVLALTLAVAGCGGGKGGGVASLGGAGTATGTTSTGGGDSTQADLAYARCMRQHGLPGWPDPKVDANGRTDWRLPEGVGPDDPKVKAARQACRQYRGNGGQAQRPSPQQQQELLAFARCMRQHGIDMPDPQPDGSVDMRGINREVRASPKFKAAERACPQFRPKY